MPQKAGDFIRRAMARLSGLQELEAKTLYSDALRSLYAKEKWLFLLQNDIIQTVAPYTTGTIQVTNGSAALVGTSTVWDATWINRRIVIEGRSEVYDVLLNSATSATLKTGGYNGTNALWPGESASELTYRIYRDVYPLRAECDWGRDYFWWDPANGCPLPLVDQIVMLIEKSLCPGTLGQPRGVCRAPLAQTAATAVPVSNVEFGPYVPDDVYSFPVWYFKKPAVTTSDLEYPLWPEEFEDLISLEMEVEYGHNPRHRLPVGPAEQKLTSRLWECKKRNDGGAEITRIKEMYAAQYARAPFSNVRISGSGSGWPVSGGTWP